MVSSNTNLSGHPRLATYLISPVSYLISHAIVRKLRTFINRNKALSVITRLSPFSNIPRISDDGKDRGKYSRRVRILQIHSPLITPENSSMIFTFLEESTRLGANLILILVLD